MRAVSMMLPFVAWLLALAAPASAAAAATPSASSSTSASLVLQIGVAQAPQQQQQDAAQAQHQVFLAGLPAWTHATLEAGDGRLFVSAPMTASGRLVFHNVTPGSYLGEVQCATHVFAPLRVDVLADGVLSEDGSGSSSGSGSGITVTETFRGNDWANRGPALPRLEQPGDGSSTGDAAAVPTFAVAPVSLQPKNFYAVRETFSVFNLLKNPMILMGLVGLVVMFGVPYLMDNMDPEMRAEYEERQKSSPMNSILSGGGPGPGGGGFDMAAFLAGTNTNGGGGGGGGAGGGGGNKNNNRNQGGRR